MLAIPRPYSRNDEFNYYSIVLHSENTSYKELKDLIKISICDIYASDDDVNIYFSDDNNLNADDELTSFFTPFTFTSTSENNDHSEQGLLSNRFTVNEIAKIKLNSSSKAPGYPFRGPSQLFVANKHNIVPEVKMIPYAISAVNYQFLTNTREHPMSAKQFCERIIDREYGDDYVCQDIILNAK